MDSNEELRKMMAQQEEETIDLKEYIYKFLHYWYWFVLAGFIGFAGAYFYNKYIPPSYDVTSTLVVEEESTQGTDLEQLFSGYTMGSNVKLQNHIGILKSYNINYLTVENLGWFVSWYRNMPLGDYDLYGKEPYAVEFDNSDMNIKGVPVHISNEGNGKFMVTVDATTTVNDVEMNINLEQEGEFGKSFTSNYFNFILYQSGTVDNNDYYFQFNDLEKLTLSYMDRLDISAVDNDADLINIKLSGQNPLKDIEYINELMEQYIEYGMKQKNLTSENTIQFIDLQLMDIVDTLEVTGNQLTNFRTENRVYNLDESASMVLERLVELDSDQSMAQMQLDYYENLRDYMDNANQMKNVAFPSVVGITDTGLNTLVTRLSELYTQRETLLLSMNERNPSVQLVDRELELVRQSLSENLNNLVENTKQEIATLTRQISQVNAELSNYPQTEQDLINYERLYDLNNELYTFLLEKRAEAQITRASNTSDVKILDEANKATLVQVGPRTMVNFLIGLMLAVAIPFIIILVREFFDESIHGKEDLQKLSLLPVVGNISHNPFGIEIPVIDHPRSILAESLRDLRTNLSYLFRESGPMAVGVNSVVPGEGKSFIALNLAAIIAKNKKKVILIGADMRKPTLQDRLGIDKDRGLSTYLINKNTLEEIIHETSVPGLDFIPSGVIPPNPAELLETTEFKQLIEELKKRYDVIILDNSPATLVTDSAIVSLKTDVDLFVVRQGYSNRNLVDFINQLSNKNKEKKIGLVVNDITPQKFSKYSYKYGGYYRKAYGSGYAYFDEEDGKKKKLI